MSVLGPEETRPSDVDETGLTRAGTDQDSQGEERGGHSRWMMIACCIPMLLIAVLLVASGAGIGFLLIALLCTAMMAAMMGGMSRGGGEGDASGKDGSR